MAYYSREFARTKDWDAWDVDLADEFLYLDDDKKKAHQKIKTKSVSCDGFEITKIRILKGHVREVLIHGEWVSYNALLKS